MYPRGNSRSATATPTGSPKRRLPQIPGGGQGLPSTTAPATSNRMPPGGGRAGLRGMEQGVTGGSMGGYAPYHASYDEGLNNGQIQRGHSLHPSTRSRSMGHYGGYSDTEVMVPTNDQRYYDPAAPAPAGGRAMGYGAGPAPQQPVGLSQGGSGNFDPYYENMRAQQPPMQAPMAPLAQQGGYGGSFEDRRAQPPPPPPRNVNFEGDPPIKSSGGPRGAPPIGRKHHYGDSDMESVTSALSSHSAPHQRPRRPGYVFF